MNIETSRRSACDRCRGQKLRCVRPSKPANGIQLGDEPLDPCERCLKAGADCINTHLPPRKLAYPDRNQTVSNTTADLSSSDKPASQPPFQSRAQPYQHDVSMDLDQIRETEPITSKKSSNDNDMPSVYQRRTSFLSGVGACGAHGVQPRPRSKDHTFNGPQVNMNEVAQLRGPISRRKAQGDNRRSAFVNTTMSIDHTTDSLAFGSEDHSSNHQHQFNLDGFNLDIGLSPKFSSHFDDNFNICATDNVFLSDQLPRSQATIPSLTNSANAGLTNVSEQQAIQPLEMKDEYLTQLSELSSRLLKDFSKASSAQASEILSSTFCCQNRSSANGGDPSSAMPTESIVGKVLENSQVFVDLLTNFVSAVPSSATSDCSYTEIWDDTEFLSGSIEQSNSNSSQIISRGSENSRSSVGTAVSSGSTQTSSSSIKASIVVDMPSTFMMLTCYTCLLQTYDIIFSRIYIYLSSQCDISPRSTPSLFSGISIAGVSLDDHSDVQMEIFMQLASKMLERIEVILGINVATQSTGLHEHKGILDSALAPTLLEVMFRQRNLMLPTKDARDPRPGMVRQTMENVRSLLGCSAF